ncbi:MAG: DUF1499 domain-containing protein [Gammaproteobacteria bacterium]|nr:DUF1499 domain-containing protein [Gammaproteobacteria bacterium]
MKIFIILIGLLAFSVVVYFFILGNVSTSKQSPGLVAGKLSACSPKPNCVCSEIEQSDSHYIAPLTISITDNNSLMLQIKSLLKEMGAEIVTEDDSYIAATFTSRLFRFVDDFEIRLDAQNNLVHVRSASRVGRSDFGVNRQRVEEFRTRLDAADKNL